MPNITAEMFASLKQQTLDEYVQSLGGQLIEYHKIIRTGVDARWGFAEGDTPLSTVMTELLFTHVYLDTEQGRKKKLHAAGDDIIADYDLKVYIPTLDLERKSIVLERDDTFLRMKDGAEYQIQQIHPLPRMHGTSLTHRLYCKKRKPIVDVPGGN